MAQEVFSVALNAAEFPFVSDFLSRTVVVPGLDAGPRSPARFSGDPENAALGVAQHYFGQNIVPTAKGIMSVGYSQVIAEIEGTTNFDQVIVLRDEDENNYLLVPALGTCYIYTEATGTWTSYPFGGFAGGIISRAYVNGRTFVNFEHNSVREFTGGTFNALVLTGIDVTKIDCIGASNNYLIACIGVTVYWSSLIDPLDFVVNINTGANNAIPQDMKGIARAIVPIAGGFVIYTTRNAVVALYTNNARAPFVFREIQNAGGVSGPEQVSVEASLGYHYAWTTNGLQKITVQGAENLSASVTDFLAGRVFEVFDSTTLEWTFQRLTSANEVAVKLAYISGRYLILSYKKKNSVPYTHALVFDTALQRWGKLKFNHMDCFQYPYPNLPGEITEPPPKQSIALLTQSGEVDLAVIDYRNQNDENSDACLLLGKYQLVRQRVATFQTLELEGLNEGFPPSVYLLLSHDGKTNEPPVELSILHDGGRSKKYGAPVPAAGAPAVQRTAKNFSFLIAGTFELSTAIVTLTQQGRR